MLYVFDSEDCVLQTSSAQSAENVQDTRNTFIADGMDPNIKSPLRRIKRKLSHCRRVGDGNTKIVGLINKRLAQLGGFGTEGAVGKNFDCLQAKPFVAESTLNAQRTGVIHTCGRNRMDDP